MAVRVLISPPASGKTQRCIERLRRQVASNSPRLAWVIVPDRLQVRAFQNRMAAGGGVLGVRVDTFAGLYREILARAGASIPQAGEPLLQRLIWEAIEAVEKAGHLHHYGPIQAKTGFLLSLRGRFAELKRARVFPEAFLEDSLIDGDIAQIELARLYQVYQERLLALNWADEEGLGWLAVQALDREAALLEDVEMLVVDGFDSFVTTQLDTLQRLSAHLPEILITLPGNPEHDRPALRRFERSRRKLKLALQIEERLAPDAIRLPDPLARIERDLFESRAPTIPPSPNLKMLEARGPAEEAREALRWLKALWLRKDVPSSECSLVVPDLDLYRTPLRLAAQEFGMTLHFSQGDFLVSAPIVDALLGLLRLPLEEFAPRSLVTVLRSPYFHFRAFGLESEHADALENVCRFGQVVSGLVQWEEALNALSSRRFPEKFEARREERAYPHLPSPAEARVLQAGLQRLTDRLTTPGLRPLGAWLDWLAEILEDLGFYPAATRERDRTALAALDQTLTNLRLADRVARQDALAYGGFLAHLTGALEPVRYDPHGDTTGPAILIVPVIEARGLRFQATGILGLAEGLFPEVERADPFLKEALRTELGLEPRLGRDQAGLFYHAVTRADRYLLFTRPYLAEQGEPWEPSPFWHAVSRLLEDRPKRIQPRDRRPLSEAASMQEALFWAARQTGPQAQVGELLTGYGGRERWRHIRRASQVLAARLAPRPAGSFEGGLGRLKERLGDRFQHWQSWSPSGLEVYTNCPHRFFAERVLDLEARETPEVGFDAAQLGSMLHAILEKTYRSVEDPTDEEALLNALEETANREFEQAPDLYGFRANVTWEVEKAGLRALLRENVSALVSESEGWTPIGLELPFGIRGTPPLELNIDDRRLQIRGLIDRVDRDPAGRLRVIDYKTGGSHLSARDLETGRRLQLPLYALAAEQALGLGSAAEGFYWHLRGTRPGGLKLSRFKGALGEGPEGALATAKSHVATIVEDVNEGLFPPIPPDGGCPSYCAAAAWCWRYTPGYS